MHRLLNFGLICPYCTFPCPRACHTTGGAAVHLQHTVGGPSSLRNALAADALQPLEEGGDQAESDGQPG